MSETSLYLFFSFTQLIVILSVRNRGHFWRAATPSRPLMGAMALTAMLALALPYVPVLSHLFAFSALPLSEIGVVVVMTALYLLVLDTVKASYYRAVDSPRAPRWLSQRSPAASTPPRSAPTRDKLSV